MTTEFNMEIAVHNIIACRRRAKPQDVAQALRGMPKRTRSAADCGEQRPRCSHCRGCCRRACRRTIAGLPISATPLTLSKRGGNAADG